MKKRAVDIFCCIGLLLAFSPVFAQADAKMELINEAKKEVTEIAPKELKGMFEDEKSAVILDVRETEQRAEGYIYDDFVSVNTISITRGNLEWEVLDKITDKNMLVVTYCRNGGRGALAAQTLKKMGYKNVKNLKGGLADWAKAGYSVKTGLGVTKLTTGE
ncbi:MAG: rhodanese-like domain-containing protein [Sulfurimonas sp.]|uniref:rhodanese-like domain-containing protein n=1 Tax=Sulfurimonas sp. TaxID=2022749 RepID=UPI00262C7A45|nr:rhodanese-like domain-containing protein [Sulfurimonas sp.]MDD2653165.1 rhodanese-like domain-containing protein [Sulfurimonas sp.]MDD3450587.1 rhodanese-like domain-containing protein [Sulfurimonas sp.]